MGEEEKGKKGEGGNTEEGKELEENKLENKGKGAEIRKSG